MPIDDAFALKVPDKVVVVGVVSEGEVRPGDRLLVRTGSGDLPVSVEALEAFNQPVQSARKGDRVAVLLVGTSRDGIPTMATLVSAQPSSGK